MKRKIVYVMSHGPLSFSNSVEIGWEDVWLRTHSGRHPLKLAPCLVSREHLRSDLAMTEKIVGDDTAQSQGAHIESAEELRAVLRQLDERGYVIDREPKIMRRSGHPGREFGLANVYTSRAWINRAEAERMIDVYLAALGIRNASYKWKGSRFFAWPTTLNADGIAGVES
jgi:hypothetical protein